MRFAALLPKHSADHLRRILPQVRTVFATSCGELREILRTELLGAALVDPEVNRSNTDAVLGVIRGYPRARVIAYVQNTAPSLHAVFGFSKERVEDVFVHPVKESDPRFLNIIRRIEADRLASGVLAAAESKLQILAPPVRAAMLDLFRRPYRYVCAQDLADEAGVCQMSL